MLEYESSKWGFDIKLDPTKAKSPPNLKKERNANETYILSYGHPDHEISSKHL